MTTILGVSASLRNARFGAGSERLVRELADLRTEAELKAWLGDQVRIRADDFVQAGRDQGKPFDEIYKALGKLKGDRGLSNSEAVLAVALWGVLQEGTAIEHLALAPHFPPNGTVREPQALRDKLLRADGLLISGPVYFGDRGSLAQSLIDFIAADPALKGHMAGKVYGGLAVGAKRNGGQETTLIYQMLDMTNMDLLAVGNSSETTAQYGGTAVGGDVGTVHTDSYGLETALGTGRRVARVAKMLKVGGAGHALRDKLRVHMWLLQDRDDGAGREYFEHWAARMEAEHPDVQFTLWDATRAEVTRCIACDVCPVDTGTKDDYRCIITTSQDFFVQNHAGLLGADAILLCAYSPEDRSHVRSVYQQFIERTRYLRRDHYAFSDLLAAPFVISELSARQNLHLRMLTSIVRHHTVMHHPIIGLVAEGRLLNQERIDLNGEHFISWARALAIGRHLEEGRGDIVYNPIGYAISAAKADEDKAAGRTAEQVRSAADELQRAREARIAVGSKS